MTRSRAGTAALAALVLSLACANPLAEGEARYREGDLRGALAAWRAVPPGDAARPEAEQRLAALESELDQLVARYRQLGAYHERRGELAEAIRSYRLALELRPGDRQTLDRVQRLARELAERKRTLREELRTALEARELAHARATLAQLRTLDPFDPQLEGEARDVEALVQVEVDRALAQGRERFEAGDLDGARAAFQGILEIDPNNEAALGYLSYVTTVQRELRRSGGLPETLRSLDALESPEELRAEGLYQNGRAAERRGDPWRAIRYYTEALRVNPRHPQARTRLAELRRSLAPRVEELIEEGRKHFRREDLRGALDYWRRVLLVDPDNEQARTYVARAERMLDRLERLRAGPNGNAEPDGGPSSPAVGAAP